MNISINEIQEYSLYQYNYIICLSIKQGGNKNIFGSGFICLENENGFQNQIDSTKKGGVLPPRWVFVVYDTEICFIAICVAPNLGNPLPTVLTR